MTDGGEPPVTSKHHESALAFMMVMYALERGGRTFILAFAVDCLLSSI
jgi:hypothetical protein